MRRRILVTVVLVTALALTTLFVPAAVAIGAKDLSAQEVEVERDAAIAAAAIPAGDAREADLPSDDDYGLYGRDGRLVAGRGPAQAEAEVRAAFDGGPALLVERDQVVAGLALASADPEVVLRVAEPRSEARSDTTHSVVLLGLAALAILLGAAAASWVLATRLARPVEALGQAAARLDAGEYTATPAPSGIEEVDQVASTLARTGARIESTMARERSFSADASHQLRTPLTAMRTAVEAEQLSPRDDHGAILAEVLGQVDRMDETLTALLALARDTHVDRRPVDLGAVVAGAADRWRPGLTAAGRRLVVDVPSPAPRPAVSAAALDHALDVLVDNALQHGRGTVRITVDEVGPAARVTVADEGRLDGDRATIFDRRPPGAVGTGIGLHLARSLVEAEGGRLRLTTAPTTAFEIVLPAGPGPAPAPG